MEFEVVFLQVGMPQVTLTSVSSEFEETSSQGMLPLHRRQRRHRSLDWTCLLMQQWYCSVDFLRGASTSPARDGLGAGTDGRVVRALPKMPLRTRPMTYVLKVYRKTVVNLMLHSPHRSECPRVSSRLPPNDRFPCTLSCPPYPTGILEWTLYQTSNNLNNAS